MIDLLKISIKTNTSSAHHFRLQEHKHLHRARTFRLTANREEASSDEQREDLEKSERFYNNYQNLRQRRVQELRKKARHELLAYAFIRGFDYEEVEELTHFTPDFDIVERIVFDYLDEDPRVVKQQFEEWVQLAQAHLKREKGVKE